MACARAGAPLRRALARLAGRLVAREGWEPLGFVRLADYARERLGISPREIQDLARVDARLAELPRIDAAFRAGRLTWTQTRLLCRAATPGDETQWIALAGSTSAARLAREVRALDRAAAEPGALEGERTDETGTVEEPFERVRVPCSPRVRSKWGDACRLARQVSGAPLRFADVAERVAAEVIAGIGLDVDPDDVPAARRLRHAGAADAPPLPAPDDVPAASVHAPRFLESLLNELETASPSELDARLRRAVALERRLLARVGPMLLELAASRGYRNLGLRSVDQYARERLGMAPRTARALIRLERACLASPALCRAWRSGALPWSKAQVLVGLFALEASRPWHGAWLERARLITLRRLEDDVEHALAGGDLDPAVLPSLPSLSAVREGAVPEGVQNGARPSSAGTHTGLGPTLVLGMPRSVARLFGAALATVRRRFEREAGRSVAPGEALEAMLDHVHAAWWEQRTRQPKEHGVFERDGWRCVVPGCSSRRNLHAHHIVFRSAGGSDDAANLTTLCAAHHQRGVHGGRIRITGQAPARLVFDLPTGRYRAGDVRLGGGS